jgi:hypothetical protein
LRAHVSQQSPTSQKYRRRGRRKHTRRQHQVSHCTSTLETDPISTCRKVPNSSSNASAASDAHLVSSKSPSQQLQTVLLFTLQFAASPHPPPRLGRQRNCKKELQQQGAFRKANELRETPPDANVNNKRHRNAPKLFSVVWKEASKAHRGCKSSAKSFVTPAVTVTLLLRFNRLNGARMTLKCKETWVDATTMSTRSSRHRTSLDQLLLRRQVHNSFVCSEVQYSPYMRSQLDQAAPQTKLRYRGTALT